MKTIKKQFKSVALILSMLIIFQGCTVYKSANVSLEKAYNSQTKVKVKTKDNQTHKFKRLEFEDEQYFGIKEFHKDDPNNLYKKKITKTLLDVNNIENIKIKNKTMSTILPFAIPVAILGILIGAWVLAGSPIY